ncbi:MAG TPA: hypothetical protein VNO70_13675 [Blastocatellia bacterium]|nr:hypothetical protein [Blastocatellia bacterium]
MREVQANDHILLWTQKSVYSFLVTEKSQLRGKFWLRGKLWRSSRGEQAAEAMLFGGAVEAGDPSIAGRAELRANERALFVFPFGDQAKRLLTSAITRVIVLKDASNLNSSRKN